MSWSEINFAPGWTFRAMRKPAWDCREKCMHDPPVAGNHGQRAEEWHLGTVYHSRDSDERTAYGLVISSGLYADGSVFDEGPSLYWAGLHTPYCTDESLIASGAEPETCEYIGRCFGIGAPYHQRQIWEHKIRLITRKIARTFTAVAHNDDLRHELRIAHEDALRENPRPNVHRCPTCNGEGVVRGDH